MKYLFSICLILFLIQCTSQNVINSKEEFISVLEEELNLKNAYVGNKIENQQDAEFYLLINGEPNNDDNLLEVIFSKNKSGVKDLYSGMILTFMHSGLKKEKIELFTESTRMGTKSDGCLFSYYENYLFIIEGDEKFIDKSSAKVCKYLEQLYR